MNPGVCALLVVFGFLIPMEMQMDGPEVLQGRSYNPSVDSWQPSARS